jgi:cell wall assembly regulator SMI1
MTFAIKKQFVPLVDESAVASLEATTGHTFPSDYRQFLLANNGGEPVNPVFNITNAGKGYSDSAVRYFFSIADKSTFSLKYKYEIYSGAGRIAREMLPIATDAGGNLVVLALAGEQVGKVFFWNHEVEGLEVNPASAKHLTFLANSFTEFCDRLLPFS